MGRKILNAGATSAGSRYTPPPSNSVRFLGNGNNVIYIDWETDLVIVVRWIRGNAIDAFVGKVLAAMRRESR